MTTARRFDLDRRFRWRLNHVDHTVRRTFPDAQIGRAEECESGRPGGAGEVQWHDSLGVIAFYIDGHEGRELEFGVTISALLGLSSRSLLSAVRKAAIAAVSGSQRTRCVVGATGDTRWVSRRW